MSNVSIKNIVKNYGKVIALDGLSLTLSPGKILAVLGSSGSGKSTLLRVLAGFEYPDQGSVSVADNTLVNSSSFVKPEDRNIGLVFQNFALFPHLTVEQNIAFGLNKWNQAERVARVEEMLKLGRLSDLSKRYPHELSGGQQQRVALVRALAQRPSLLLLDEPFSNLDEGLKEEIRLSLKEMLGALNMTTILVSHDVRDAMDLADELCILDHGKVMQAGSISEVLGRPSNMEVAKLFAPVFRLPSHWCTALGLDNATECFAWVSRVSDTPSGAIKGKVVKVRNWGSESQLRVEDDQGFCIDVKTSEQYDIGSPIHLELLTQDIFIQEV